MITCAVALYNIFNFSLSVATYTSSNDFAIKHLLNTCTIIGKPAMSSNGLFGKRLDSNLAGIIATDVGFLLTCLFTLAPKAEQYATSDLLAS